MKLLEIYEMTAIMIIIYIAFMAVIIMSPAILGAILRIFLRAIHPITLGILTGVVMTLLYSAVSGDHGLTYLVRTFQETNFSERMTNFHVTAIIAFQIFLMSAIASIGIRFIDRKKNSQQGVAGYPPQGVGSPER